MNKNEILEPILRMEIVLLRLCFTVNVPFIKLSFAAVLQKALLNFFEV